MSFRCTRCVYDTTVPHITFDTKGVCNYCHNHDLLVKQYPTGEKGKKYLEKTAEKIRKKGKNKDFDCIVGISGGCDSTYLLYVAKEIMGLRPLAVHFNNTWNTAIATENMQKIIQKLQVPFEEYRVDPEEYSDINRSFLKAGVPDIDISTDIGLASVLNRAAEKHNLQYVIEGHNFRTEGISPLGWIYMDGKYIESVQQQFGTLPLKTYPNMPLTTQLRWMLLRRIRKIRPLWYMDFNKEEIKHFLQTKFDWQWYGGHHLENQYTAFTFSYFVPKRYGIDTRLLGYAAMVRSGKMNREIAIEELQKPFYMEPELLEYIKARLHITDLQLESLIHQPQKTYRDYNTYKRTFERMSPFFWLMAKMQLIPYSFYLKYTRPDPLQVIDNV